MKRLNAIARWAIRQSLGRERGDSIIRLIDLTTMADDDGILELVTLPFDATSVHKTTDIATSHANNADVTYSTGKKP